jgi:four helix bundle protein
MRDHKTLLCWQLSRDLTVAIHRLAVHRWTPPASAAFDQLRRASLSIRLNIVEGHALASPGGFARHLNIAYGSTIEAHEILEYCVETDLLAIADVKPLLKSSQRIQALIIRLKRRCLTEAHQPKDGG